MSRYWFFGLGLLVLSGCASYGVVDNVAKSGSDPVGSYSIRSGLGSRNTEQIALILTFSGGGTRAAALAYGVMEELRDTRVVIDGRPRRLLDEVGVISSVSGGSFTSAYYGLYGDRLFDDFEEVFLRRDVEGQLIRGLLNPLRWFSSTGRTEMAVKFYEETIFHGATFADLKRRDGPLILINASDLGYGVRFSFVQEYFNLLCSDITSFPVARAVSASSAVPILFEPVVVRNYKECKTSKPDWLLAAEKRATNNPQLIQVVDGLQSYFLKERDYAHFVDGGITDNTGLLAIYEVVEVTGGAEAFARKMGWAQPRRVVVISVDANTNPSPKIDSSYKDPSIKETITAVTKVQLQRYNLATEELLQESGQRWERELSTPGRPVTLQFIRVGFRDFEQPEIRRYFDQIPTSFKLSNEQVDRLIAAGRELLRNNPEYRRLVSDLGGA